MSHALHFIVLSDGDTRAAALTRASIARVAGARSFGVVREDREPREGRLTPIARGDEEAVYLSWWESQHEAALALARESVPSGLACILREGAIVRPSFAEGVAERFSAEPALAGLLLGIGRSRNINGLAPADLAADDPWHLLPDGFEAGSEALKARYQRPAALVLRMDALGSRSFEKFSSLADWYAYRHLFGDGDEALAIDATSPLLGYIGSKPDRRNAYDQGRQAARTLYQIAFAYPRFQGDVSRDFRTLLRSQGNGLASRGWRIPGRFLAGMAAAALEERRRRHKLNRDISQIS